MHIDTSMLSRWPADCLKSQFSSFKVLLLLHVTMPIIFFFSDPEVPTKIVLASYLGEKLKAISSMKAVPEGLQWIECEWGIGGKNSLICYIPKQDPVQDATSSWPSLTLTQGMSSRWQFGHLGLPSSFYCMYTLQFMGTSQWGLTQVLPKPQRLLRLLC